jgi:hypothetical protein
MYVGNLNILLYTPRNTLEMRNIGSYLYRVKCRWKLRIKELQLGCEQTHGTK